MDAGRFHPLKPKRKRHCEAGRLAKIDNELRAVRCGRPGAFSWFCPVRKVNAIVCSGCADLMRSAPDKITTRKVQV